MIARAAAAVLVAASVGASSCRREAAHPAAPDSLTGIVAVTGTSFEKSVVLRTDSTTARVIVDAADTAAIYRVAGVEIVAHGQNTRDGFRLARFRAIRVDGASVVDGTLADSSGVLVLRGESRTWPIPNPPQVLRSLIGSRVWIGGPITTGPYTYGVITPPPAKSY